MTWFGSDFPPSNFGDQFVWGKSLPNGLIALVKEHDDAYLPNIQNLPLGLLSPHPKKKPKNM
jgi:hypothetical protein